MRMLWVLCAVPLCSLLAQSPRAQTAEERWWQRQPIRFLQTNLSETDSTVDPIALVAAVADFGANTFLMNMGGIVAQYPTRVPFHYPSAHLPAGRDLFGEVLREAHARQIRVIGRFDLSKTQRPVFEAHPEWFFRRANGDPVVYNGLYSACINGGYYREHALTMLTEALERYEVDGLFFNMFGNPSTDYSGVATGPCHCEACQTRYRARYGRPVPAAADADYRAFMTESSRQVAATIAELIHRKRPDAAFLTYIHDHTDGIMSESNTAVTRPLPLWPVFGQRQREPGARFRAGQAGDQSGDELHRLSLALRPRPPGRDRASSLPEHRPWRAARPRRLWSDGPAGSQRAGRGAADLRLARAARGPLRRPEERRSRAAAGQGKHRVVSWILPPPDRGAHSVRRLREPALARGRLPLRPGHRTGRAAAGARRLRAAGRAAAGGGHGTAATADRRRRRPALHAGLLADPRSEPLSLTEGHQPHLRRRRVPWRSRRSLVRSSR